MNNSLYPQATQAMVKELITLETYVDEENFLRVKEPDTFIPLMSQVVIEWIAQPQENAFAFLRHLDTLKMRLEVHIERVNSADAEFKGKGGQSFPIAEGVKNDRIYRLAFNIHSSLKWWYGNSFLRDVLDGKVGFTPDFVVELLNAYAHKLDILGHLRVELGLAHGATIIPGEEWEDEQGFEPPLTGEKEIHVSPENIELIYNALVPCFIGKEKEFRRLLEGQPISSKIRLNGSVKEYAHSFCFLVLDKKIDSPKDTVSLWFCKYFLQKDGSQISASTIAKYFAHYEPKPSVPMLKGAWDIIFGLQA